MAGMFFRLLGCGSYHNNPLRRSIRRVFCHGALSLSKHLCFQFKVLHLSIQSSLALNLIVVIFVFIFHFIEFLSFLSIKELHLQYHNI